MDFELGSHLRLMMARGRHARSVFLIATLICGVLALDATFLGGRAAGRLEGVRSTFGPLLLWALTAVVYAFHLLSRSHAGMAQRSESILEADGARAFRQLLKIKRRLRASGPRDAH